MMKKVKKVKLLQKKKLKKHNTNIYLKKVFPLYNDGNTFFIKNITMKVILYWDAESVAPLQKAVASSLDELGLAEFLPVEVSNSDELKTKLDISEVPALIINEESIDFEDVIFQWMVPSEEEIKSMFISVIWWNEGGWSCGSKEADGSCGTWCAC